MSQDYYDPTDPERRPKPLDYATGTRRRSWVDSIGTGCLIAIVTLILVVGVVFGTCVLMH